MLRSHPLTWGTTHSLLLSEQEGRKQIDLRATLMIRKPKGRQDLTVSLPPTLTIDVIKNAWEAQGTQWDEIILYSGMEVFSAVRVIWLPTGALLWNVLHIEDAPYDTFGLTNLTKHICHSRFEQKVITGIAP